MSRGNYKIFNACHENRPLPIYFNSIYTGGNFVWTSFHVYKDIQKRTGGEIYIGVVGPVRTGKSTFYQTFYGGHGPSFHGRGAGKGTARDEIPQSAAGKTIMTTEPKFIPKEGALIHVGQDTELKIRLVDCVGYMVEGASGHMEADSERLVKTPLV